MMKQSTILSGLIGFAIVAGGTIFLLDDFDAEQLSKLSTAKTPSLQSQHLATAPLNSLQSEILQLNKDMETLQNQFNHLKQEVEHGTRLLSAALATGSEGIDPAQHDESDQQQATLDPQTAKLEAEQSLSKIASSYDNETIDEKWSGKTLEVMQQAFDSDELLGLSVLAMDCRSTLCKVEVQQNNPTQQGALEIFFPMKVADMLPDITMHHNISEDGETTTTMYLARSGYSMPDTH